MRCSSPVTRSLCGGGAINLVTVITLAVLLHTSATSLAIAFHLRRSHREPVVPKVAVG